VSTLSRDLSLKAVAGGNAAAIQDLAQDLAKLNACCAHLQPYNLRFANPCFWQG
jgi:hypothetical protein